MTSTSFNMHVTSAPVSGTSGICPAGTTASLGFWSFKAQTEVPMLLMLDKTYNAGAGEWDVELSWSGLAVQFEIFRNTSPIDLDDPGNLYKTTSLCTDTDQNAGPFQALFYLVSD